MYCIPPWVPTLDLCLSQAPHPHTFTFGTVSKDGMPRARTCVFRSWLFDDKSTGVLLFTTDLRSGKIDDLRFSDGKFEACFYFNKNDLTGPHTASGSRKSPASSVQIRLSGFAQPLMPARNFYPTLYIPLEQPTPYNMASFQPPPSPTSSSPAASVVSGTGPSVAACYYSPPQESADNSLAQQQQPAQLTAHEHKQHQAQTQQQHQEMLMALKGNAIYPIYSPRYLEKYREQFAHDFNIHHTNYKTYTNNTSAQQQLDEYSTPPPPSHSEWRAEYARMWAATSSRGKASFRRPCPGTELDESSRRQLDKLSRGVDGASDDAGKDQFVVLAMFVNSADVFYDSLNRRAKSYRVEDDEWVETDVCP